MLVLGMMGAFLLMGSTANIDTGKHNSKWHTFCASRFFILTVVAQIYNTYVFTHLYFKHKAVSKILTYLKLFHLFLILVQLYAATQKNYFENYGMPIDESNLDDVKGVILEWTLTFTVLLGFLIMSFDVAQFKFVYENFPTSKRPVIDQQLNSID